MSTPLVAHQDPGTSFFLLHANFHRAIDAVAQGVLHQVRHPWIEPIGVDDDWQLFAVLRPELYALPARLLAKAVHDIAYDLAEIDLHRPDLDRSGTGHAGDVEHVLDETCEGIELALLGQQRFARLLGRERREVSAFQPPPPPLRLHLEPERGGHRRDRSDRLDPPTDSVVGVPEVLDLHETLGLARADEEPETEHDRGERDPDASDEPPERDRDPPGRPRRSAGRSPQGSRPAGSSRGSSARGA